MESPYKESGTGYGERPLTGPIGPTFQGVAGPSSALDPLPGGRPALSKPGLGREVLTGHISCVEGKVREKKGETKRVEQNGGREDGKGSEERKN